MPEFTPSIILHTENYHLVRKSTLSCFPWAIHARCASSYSRETLSEHGKVRIFPISHSLRLQVEEGGLVHGWMGKASSGILPIQRL
jgi:hypothetical protein